MPARQPRGLAGLAATLGIEGDEFHRALADARTAALVFARLIAQVERIPIEQRRNLATLVSLDNMELANLLAGEPISTTAISPKWMPSLTSGVPPVSLTRRDPLLPLQPDDVRNAYAEAPNAISGFEDRPQQMKMAMKGGEAFANGGQYLIEAGTGVGKSMAYLLPAALHALRNDDRVVVSTNTIALQEQILKKDVPQLRRMLVAAGVIEDGQDLRVSLLKGRGNYLCLQKLAASSAMAMVDPDFAHLAASIFLWLPETESGDRSELSLDHNDYVTWQRLSAQDSDCLSRQNSFVRDGTCFLGRSRKAAESAHIIVVNHALLLADLASGGSAIPAYQNLVIDEAHNLEDVATRQFGAVHTRRRMHDALDAVHRPPGRDQREGGVAALLLVFPPGKVREFGERLAEGVNDAGHAAATFFTAVGELAGDGITEEERLRITPEVRGGSAWGRLELVWDPLSKSLAALSAVAVEAASTLLVTGSESEPDAIAGEVGSAMRRVDEMRFGLESMMAKDQSDAVTWVAKENDSSGSLNSAPLDAGPTLSEELFAKKRTVIATSATLSAAGDMRYMARRLGLDEAETLELGSPFDYRSSTLITAFDDFPEPNETGYDAAVADGIVRLVRASEGRALGLFTSHAALRRVATLVRPQLEEDGITVMVQGVDGNPRRLTEHLVDHPRSVILGTQSFWEGVDIRGQALSLLIIARLPFAVPTDPVYVARSELFDDPFGEYSLPAAILRFRQGFGRLIRSKEDRGVVAILDGRIRSKRYGERFIRSLPNCSKFAGSVERVSEVVTEWLAEEE